MSDPNQTPNVNIVSGDATGQPVTANGQITVAIVLLTTILFVTVLILYLRKRGYTGALPASSRRSRLVFASTNLRTMPSKALDRSILDSLPVTDYRSSEGDGEGSECAVCICEFTDGEKARVLPKCHHVFHAECIDMWFGSNSTCPLCRIPVSPCSDDESQIEPNQEEQGSSSSSSSSSSRRPELVIEIPIRVVDGFSSPRTTLSAEPTKSPALEKLRSLGRAMRRERGKGKEVSSSSTPRPGCDIEQGEIRQ